MGEDIEREQPSRQAFPDSRQPLDGFGRLQRAHHARKHAEHPGLFAVGRQLGRGGLGEQAPVTRPVYRIEQADLSSQAENWIRAPPGSAG